jgi:uncharacterized protein YcnI
VRTVKGLVAGVVVALVLVAGAGAAWAHTAFEPDTAAPGSVITLQLAVANEIDGQSTTKVELLFPDGMPLPVVELPPVAGWTATPTGGGLGADTTATGVTWSRPSGPAGESPRLPVRLGPLPELAQRLQFPVLQTYSNGEIVRWIEPTAEGGEEPEHPMAILTLVPGGPGDPPPATTATTAAGTPDSSTTTRTGEDAGEAATTSAGDGDGDGGSATGWIIAVIVLVVISGGGVALWRRARRASP